MVFLFAKVFDICAIIYTAFILICLPSKWRQLLLLPLLMIIVLQLKWPTQYFLLSFGQQYLSLPFTSTLKPLSLVYSFTYVIGFLQVVKEVHWCKNRRVRPKPPTAKMARASGRQRQRGGEELKTRHFSRCRVIFDHWNHLK